MKYILFATLVAMLVACGETNETASTTSNIEPTTKIIEETPIVTEVADTSALIPAGWLETVLSVTNLDDMVSFYVDILGWEVRDEGDVPSNQLAAWNLPEGASASYVLVANPGSETGYVRIIDFDGVEQVRIRNHAQAWETGGIYNMNVRVADIASAEKHATEAGWQAPSAPVNFQFGPFDVWEWIPRHKDDVRVAFVQRVAPVLEGWPNLKTSSRAFNSTQIVTDMERAVAFYQGILGFQTSITNRSPSPAPAEHVLGLSREAMMQVTRDVRIVSPTGATSGSIELLMFEDYSGRDFSDRAIPPNLGNLMLRYTVPSVDNLATYLKEAGIELEYEPINTVLAPYGSVRIFAIRAPDGAWLEFFEET